MPNNKIAISWMELLLVVSLVFSGLGIWTYVERQVNLHLKAREPKEDDFQREAEVSVLEGKLADAKSEAAALREKLNSERIDLARQKFKIAALTAAQPQLLNAPAGTAGKRLPAELRKEHDKARIEWAAQKQLVDKLNKGLANSQRMIAERAAELAEAQKSSAQKFLRAQERFARTRKWATLRQAGPLLVAAFAVAFGLIYAIARKSPAALKPVAIVAGAVLLLLVLLAYQMFDMMGAAIIGTFILLCLVFFTAAGTRPAPAE